MQRLFASTAAFLAACFILLIAASPAFAQQIDNIETIDRPNDDGKALLIVFDAENAEGWLFDYQVNVDGEWYAGNVETPFIDLDTAAGHPEWFTPWPARPDANVLVVQRYLVPRPGETDDEGNLLGPELLSLKTGQEYQLRLVAKQNLEATEYAFTGEVQSATLRQQWFNVAKTNNLILSVLFALIIMLFIFKARRNPNIFIRRIQGLEAVDEAIGRATEMGRPVMQINGLDPLSTLSTVAAVNILGRIARRIADYDSELLVPCFDPVVMTVSQEVVRNAYLEAGRPDAYREDNIFFLTDQQFSYTASVCGIMMRDRPAANFMLGYFYAESLLLAETGFTTGAIQIAGTDAQAQLPFFITTCDYTLIGEELYAASAYLSREPMLLGSLRGQDIAKGFVLVLLLLGTLMATIGSEFLQKVFTAI